MKPHTLPLLCLAAFYCMTAASWNVTQTQVWLCLEFVNFLKTIATLLPTIKRDQHDLLTAFCMTMIIIWILLVNDLSWLDKSPKDSPVESFTGRGAPYWCTRWVVGGGDRVFRQSRTGSGLSVSVLAGLWEAADARWGAAHRMVSPVAELWHAGGAGVTCAVSWERWTKIW